ncbi:MAG: glycosyltransferase [Oscillospiraceae bacterium]
MLSRLEREGIDIIHSHCPYVSTVLARVLRYATGVPIVFTYHTKFDIDIDRVFASDALRRASIKFLIGNINACDDVWVVSQGAGENLRSLGYEGDFIVMENGTDFERRRACDADVAELRAKHDIKEDETVFLFVGRMMWYKGVKLSLDGLRAARESGAKCRFILIGKGPDFDPISDYIKELGMDDCCEMTGAIYDRELLRTYFTLADLFLFPSSFDTNGIVVREAAACYCPSLLLRGSCAAEGISDGETGIIVDNDAVQMRDRILWACDNQGKLAEMGSRAAQQIYISWDDAIAKACARYREVLGRKDRTREDEHTLREAWGTAFEQLVDSVSFTRDQMRELMWSTRDRVDQLMGQAGLKRSGNVRLGRARKLRLAVKRAEMKGKRVLHHRKKSDKKN